MFYALRPINEYSLSICVYILRTKYYIAYCDILDVTETSAYWHVARNGKRRLVVDRMYACM